MDKEARRSSLVLFATIITVAVFSPYASAQLTLTDSSYSGCASCVGIGTSTPTEKLHVEGDDAQIFVEDTTTSPAGTRTLFMLENYGGVRFDMEDNYNGVTWVFQTQTGLFDITKAGTGVKELSLDGSGNLTITGTLTVRDGETNETTYPDYVFEPDYELMPLADLNDYVTENKHLPEIPSAKTLAAEGLNMTEMQIKLLQKVEELTLYTISLEESIQSQNSIIEEQQGAIEAQQEAIEELRSLLDSE